MLAAFALAVLLLAQFAVPVSTPLPEASTLAARRLRPVQATPTAEYAEVLSAPLFSPSRRAAGATAVSGAGTGSAPLSAPSGPDRYVLLGAATGNRLATALVRGPEGVRAVRPGQSLGGWRVAAIGTDSVRLQRSGRSRVLRLSDPAVADADATPASEASE